MGFGEMEWEFSESNEGGNFMATGKVVTFLRNHLARGEMEKALGLYESCAENVGDEMLLEFPTASSRLQKAMANMFFRARDYKRAALACEQLSEWEAAARSYEASYEYKKAAACYLRANKADKAAAIFQKSGDFHKAAELYHEARDFASAAAAMEQGGDLFGAAQLAIASGDARNAARRLASIPQSDSKFLGAVVMLSELLVKMGHVDVAVQRLMAAMPPNGRVTDVEVAEVAYRLGSILAAAMRFAEATRPFGALHAFNPEYKDVAARLADATTRSNGAPPDGVPTIPPIVAGTPVADEHIETAPIIEPRVEVAVDDDEPLDQFSALDGNVFAPKKARQKRAASLTNIDVVSAQGTGGFVTRMDGYDLLKTLPIFEDLSFDEMKDFYHLCESVEYSEGAVIIEQGQPGEGLYIVREGSLRVSKLEGTKETIVAELPAGGYVGEMSLIDDGPTSARVTALSDVNAFRIAKDTFARYLFNHDLVALRVYRTFAATLVSRLRAADEKLSQAD